MYVVLLVKELDSARKLPQETAHNCLRKATRSRVRIVLGCCPFRWYIFECLHPTASLDIVRKVAARAVFHDKVYMMIRFLVWLVVMMVNAGAIRTTMSVSFVICRCDSVLRI